jgi:hypothetical protein
MNDPVDHAAPAAPQQQTSPVASIGDLAHDTSSYVHAWTTLLGSETQLARVSAVRLAFAALIIPALALAICITFDAFVAALLNRWLHDWSSCIAIVLFADLAALCCLLLGMRRWWRNLSLPRSRRALTQLLERMA